MLLNATLFVSGSKDTTEPQTQKQTKFIIPPTLLATFDATNSAQITVKGTASEGQTIELFVNDDSVDKTKVDKVINEMRSLQAKIGAIDQVTTGKKILWAQKLNEISDSIPRGVWLNKVSTDDGIFFLDGGAVSKTHDEMINIGNLASGLKNKKHFTVGLQNIEVGSIQRRLIRNTEVVDFLITAKIQ